MESTDGIVLNAINEHLEEGLIEIDVEHTNRVGKPKQNKKNLDQLLLNLCNTIVDIHQ